MPIVLWCNRVTINGFNGSMYINTTDTPDSHLKMIQKAVSLQDPNGRCEDSALMRNIVDIILHSGYWKPFHAYQNNGMDITLYSL